MDKSTQGHNGRIRVPVVLAVVAVVLLALGAAATASAHGSSAHGAGPLAAEWWLFALAALCGGAFLVGRLRRIVVAADPASTAGYRLHRGILAMAAVASAAIPVALFLLHSHIQSAAAGQCATCPMLQITATGAQFTPSAAAHTPPPKAGHESLPLASILLAVCGLAALSLAVALLLLLRRWLRGREAASATGGLPLPAFAEDEQDDAALGRAVLAGRDALEGEARAAIIACYAAMEASLVAAGVPRLESDSPADLLARAAARGALDGPAPRLLASLFREARYSTHPMNSGQLERARGALDEIAAQLTARRAAQEAAR